MKSRSADMEYFPHGHYRQILHGHFGNPSSLVSSHLTSPLGLCMTFLKTDVIGNAEEIYMRWESVNFLGLRIEERNDVRGSTKITKAILNECTSHQLEKV